MNKIMQCERHVGRKILAGMPVTKATQKQLTSEAPSYGFVGLGVGV